MRTTRSNMRNKKVILKDGTKGKISKAYKHLYEVVTPGGAIVPVLAQKLERRGSCYRELI